MADAKIFTVDGETKHVNAVYRQGNKMSGNQKPKKRKNKVIPIISAKGVVLQALHRTANAKHMGK